MKKILTLVICVAVIAGLGFMINQKIEENDKAKQETELQKRAPIEIPDPSIKKIQEVTDTTKPTVAMFYVDWCGFCKRFMPMFGEAAKEYNSKINFAVVHCEKPENQEMVQEYGIQGYPTIYLIDKKLNYKEALPSSVLRDAKALEEEIDKYLQKRKVSGGKKTVKKRK